jgi:hypothetical protein
VRIRTLSLLSIIFLAALYFAPAANAELGKDVPSIWVTVTSAPRIQYPRWKGIRTDAPDLWKPDSDWKTVAAHTQVAKLIAGNVENTTDADLRSVIEDVERRHLDLALEIGPLLRTGGCQARNEAYGKPGETEAILRKIQRNGGDLRYVAMDEPFYYGHRDESGCHESATQLAQQVAARIASMRRIFPRLQVGDIEVTSADREWVAELAQWTDAYRDAVGEPLAFLHADVAWSELAMRNLKPLAEELRQRHVPFGIIYNADGSVTSAPEWTQNAEQHFTEIESVLNIRPATAIFQSWTTYPTDVLPENRPGTLMNVALQYLQPASSLSLTHSGTEISGLLTGPNGDPVADAAVTLTAFDVGARMGPSPRHLAGIVPAGAATAVVGIRAGTEGASIDWGATGAIVGGIRYKEQGTGLPEQVVSPVRVPIQGSPPSVRTLALTPGTSLVLNLKQFPVTAGAAYTLDTSIAAAAAAEHAGYVTIVFLDASGKGISRNNIWFSPSTQTLGTVQTDNRGAFHIPLEETVSLAQPEIRAYYSGADSLRPSLAVLPSPLGDGNASMPALEQILPPRSSPLTVLGPRGDFTRIFAADPPPSQALRQWDQVSRHIQAVRFPAGMLLKMSDAALARMVRDLSSRHIALGLEILATNWFHEPICGQGIEGYSDPGSANQVVAKLLKAGGTVDFMAMDEPLWFGHFYSGKNACRSSIPELAERVAVIVKIYTAAFPRAIVGDTEPFPAVSNQPDWQTAYAAWVKAFRASTGSPLTFLHLDFNWGDPRLNGGPARSAPDVAAIGSLVEQAAAAARADGLSVGMIFDGGGPPPATDDAQWIAQAHSHIQAIRASGIPIDYLLFESWDKYPARTLPETDPNTLSGLILFAQRQ